MDRRRVLRAGAAVWAVVGAAVALSTLPSVNADARVLFGLASVMGPSAAVAASGSLAGRHERTAGALLLLSAVLTPTTYAYVLNLPALVVGLLLLVAPGIVLPGPHRGDRPSGPGAGRWSPKQEAAR